MAQASTGAAGVALLASFTALNEPPFNSMCCLAVAALWHAEQAALAGVIATSPVGVERSGPASIVVAMAVAELGG